MSAASGARLPDGDPELLNLGERPGEAAKSPHISVLSDTAYDPRREREKTRGFIALILVFALCGIILLAFAFAFFLSSSGKDIEILKAVLEIVFAPVVGLVGAVTGFYFGEKSRS